ncbi:MAG: putative histidine kinase, partial [Proteobacteria bacterium]|nr:putative histidine kinase [Pseudomonadota bacterium]
ASLHGRILITSSLVLAGFLGMTGLVLDEAFRDSAETALRDRLQGYVYALLAGSEVDSRGVLRGPAELHEPRLKQPGSGLYAEIRRRERDPSWRSPSSVGIDIPLTKPAPLGQSRFARVPTENGTPLFVLNFRVLWEEGLKKPRAYNFRVAETTDAYDAQIQQFRRSLWGWLGGAALLLLAVQGLILRWGLAPLRRVAGDLEAIEAGQATRLSGEYPTELQGLTDNLNALLESSRSHLARYRDALGDLAHSLKTPLAVLRGAMETREADADNGKIAQEQIQRMTQIIEYQLHRAATAGRTRLAPPVKVLDKAREVKSALVKVYADKPVECRMDIDESVEFHGDEGDLLEVMGNLLDNAFKWCRGRIRVSAKAVFAEDGVGRLLDLRVHDDGPGIPDAIVASLVKRGGRADDAVPGHGLGLAIVESIVDAYQGTLAVRTSPLGGAEVAVRL